MKSIFIIFALLIGQLANASIVIFPEDIKNGDYRMWCSDNEQPGFSYFLFIERGDTPIKYRENHCESSLNEQSKFLMTVYLNTWQPEVALSPTFIASQVDLNVQSNSTFSMGYNSGQYDDNFYASGIYHVSIKLPISKGYLKSTLNLSCKAIEDSQFNKYLNPAKVTSVDAPWCQSL